MCGSKIKVSNEAAVSGREVAFIAHMGLGLYLHFSISTDWYVAVSVTVVRWHCSHGSRRASKVVIFKCVGVFEDF